MKNIVICCDGTSNDISGVPTNVLRLYRSLLRDDSQLTYYDSGVGTIPDPSMMSDPGKAVGKKLDMAMGYSVKNQACSAYRFLCENWEPDDRIYLFGFSRGAYAVRALAGMMFRLGMLRHELAHLDQLGWSVYASADFQACSNFKYSFSQQASISVHFIGVWDTVSSFGRMTNFKTLPNTSNMPTIDKEGKTPFAKHIRHAVAIDEKRVCFKANLFRPKDNTQHESFKQIWFAGSHCDVGGGYPEEESGLAKIALEWMYREAASLECKLNEDQVEFFLGRSEQGKRFNQCVPNPLQDIHHSIQGFWKIAEFLPRRQWSHDPQRPGMRWHGPNFFRPRVILDGATFHTSVKTKLDANKTYSPKNLPAKRDFGD